MHDVYTLAIFSQLQRVEYLRVSVGYMLGGIEEFTEKLKKIPSSSLKYLALSVQHQSIADSIHPTSQSLFAAIPSLLVIDIFEAMPSSGPPMSTRLVREDVMVPTAPVVDEDVVERLSTLWHGVDDGAESRMLIKIVNM
ncbi:hypothetical protein ONZ45_g11961 [Pleurotus djamor]|nr:hypothetical protein ONZ45_g11961 [Pleurotus djamor]